MKTRFFTRVRVVLLAIPSWLRRRYPTETPRRVLIAHHPKMIGDTLLMSHIAAKARHTWPAAEIVMTSSPQTQPLFETRPWDVEAISFDPTDYATFTRYQRPGGYDLAILPGDNRYGWFARALGARWIVGFAGDRPWYKNLLLDERRPYPDEPDVWHDMAADLVPGADPPPYNVSQWPAPKCRPFDEPAGPYAVIHVGASTALKRWLPDRWAEIASYLESCGLEVVWSGGKEEKEVLDAVPGHERRRSYVGRLDLPQLWRLLARSQLLVTPDTGVSHLARLTGTPCVTLFGPGTPQLMGNGRFFRNASWHAVIVDPYPCRNQPLLYKRRVDWVRRCDRTVRQCPVPLCMHAVKVQDVIAAIVRLRPELAAPLRG